MKTKRPIETASRCSLNPILHQSPGIMVLLDQDMCTVSPIQEPVFQAVNFFMFVNIRTELVRWTTPAELPAPEAFYLIGECMWCYIVKAKSFILRIFEILLPLVPHVIDPVGACWCTLQYCYCFHLVPF